MYCTCLLGLSGNRNGQTSSTLQNEMKLFLRSSKAKTLMELEILKRWCQKANSLEQWRQWPR